MTVAPSGRDPQVDLLKAAQMWHDAGCSILPIRADGTKKPLFDWKLFQAKRMDFGAFQFYAERNPGMGIAVICGQVSGNLEMLELEGRATDAVSLMKIAEAMEIAGIYDVWASFLHNGYCEITPSGGMHLLYRITDEPVPGNEKIARRPSTPEELAENPRDKIKVLAETRGEGGYVVVAPSGGAVHKTGLDWRCVAGQIGQIPEITWEQRQLLVSSLRFALDEMPAPEPPKPPVIRSEPSITSLMPGADFNNRATWSQILEPHGWTVSHTRGHEVFWFREGKTARDGSHSASTGYKGTSDKDRLYVWSSSTVFDTEVPYTKFGAYALLNHAGDHVAAARELGRQGYGEQRPAAPAPRVDIGGGLQAEPSSLRVPPVTAPEAPRRRSSYHQTSVGNAQRLMDEAGDGFRYVPANKEFMAFDGRRWVPDLGEAHVTRALTDMTERMFEEAMDAHNAAEGDEAAEKKAAQQLKWFHSSQMDAGMKGTIRQFSKLQPLVAAPEDFDQATGWLCLPNGMLKLDECKLYAHDRSFMATQMFGAAYDPDAQAPKFRKFMETVVPDEGMRAFVQRAVGYSLLGKPDQRAMFIIHGPKRTGKSQFLNILASLFGDYGDVAQAGSFHRVDRRGDAATPGLHNLRNKRFVSASEESEHAVLDTEALKRLTGNESITTRALYQSGQRWRPQMTLWIATNPLPQLNSDDDAIWDRVKPVPFTTQFSARGDDGTLKETAGIGESIFDEEASGILNWALEGLAMFYEAGGLDQPEEIVDNVHEYRHQTDPVSQFWGEQIDLGVVSEDAGSSIDAKSIYGAYVSWCTSSSERPITARRFHSRVRSITGINAYTKSNSRYLIPGYKMIIPTIPWMTGALV